MNYEELKRGVEAEFLKRGFTQREDEFTLTQTQQQQIVVNGTPHVQERKIDIKFICLGEGAVDDTPTVGYNLSINDNDQGDFWFSSPEDLYKYHL